MYLSEEKETLIRYDELDKCWYFESNVRKHINKILKLESYFETITKEVEGGKIISVSAKLSDLDNYSVHPFVRIKRKLSQSEKTRLTRHFQSENSQKCPENRTKFKTINIQ
ncbi:Uncharacterised protein [Streptococcus acidominimus]|nr:Uncharacterised protein [Streptococcus acidominimus]